ncbi:hypothetical protein STEG23_032143, partial [Scotinomys teguina]
ATGKSTQLFLFILICLIKNDKNRGREKNILMKQISDSVWWKSPSKPTMKQ